MSKAQWAAWALVLAIGVWHAPDHGIKISTQDGAEMATIVRQIAPIKIVHAVTWVAWLAFMAWLVGAWGR